MGSVSTGFGGVIGAFGLVRLRALPLRWLQHLRISVRIVVTVIGSPGISGTHLTSLFGRSAAHTRTSLDQTRRPGRTRIDVCAAGERVATCHVDDRILPLL
ncbi:uncharacterized protein RMCFA_0196 [Mycolicibacterium fortuitum subsp. acetamidolyticum]|uniref:Uncharacterized protein n=1 Tax=Mycolicibacterium fortuitum subsp. acetamidolyticum TaxID=144550 RepID=A0A100WL45_MYCFO|nr:uncharacterized protein RMCFA_0196 [Mycolicibacterium fortuitum subsp. acetamidolyticum]